MKIFFWSIGSCTTLFILLVTISLTQAQSCACNSCQFSCACNSSNSINPYCDIGYSLSTIGDGSLACVDINECAADNGRGPCQYNCSNTCGSFSCSCVPGYMSNGLGCDDVNECLTNNGECDQTCINTPGSHQCGCNRGFALANNGKSCYDVYQCATNNGRGPCDQTCMDIPGSLGSYQCGCYNGYVLASNGGSCNDVNECSSNVGLGYCQQNCTNTPGSFYCSCNPGYTKFGLNYCKDLDECATNNRHGPCDQTCINTPGSFQCNCTSGYVLANNGWSCNDINECSSNNGLGPCQQTCTNTIGSFSCGCTSGYALQSNGYNCSDIDECSTNSELCEHMCINEPGSFHCDCYDGYVLTDHHHSFLDGWCNDTHAVHFCLPCPCQNEGICHMCGGNGSFSVPEICQCSGGYTGRFCEVAGVSITAPSIAIPLGLLLVVLLIVIAVFCTRRIRKKEFVMTNNSIYEMIKLKVYQPSNGDDSNTSKDVIKAAVVDHLIDRSECITLHSTLNTNHCFSNEVQASTIGQDIAVTRDSIQTHEMGTASSLPIATDDTDVAPTIPARRYLDDIEILGCNNTVPAIPERSYEDNVMEIDPPLPARKYST